MKHQVLPISVLLVLVLIAAACGGNEPAPTAVPAAPTTQPGDPTAVPAAPTAQPGDPTAAPTDVPPTDVPPTAESAPPTAMPVLDMEPGWYIYSDGNDVKGLALHEGVLYAAGGGGVVAWELASGTPTKYTTLDGLGHISTYDIAICAIPELRVVVATETGLSFLDPASGDWDTTPITPEESNVATSDIDTVYCDAENGRLLIGYYGLGVLDLNSGAFQQFTDDEGLVWNGVRDIAVSNGEIWLASGYNGVSVISGDTVTAYNEAAGMPDERVYSVAAAPDGTIWVGARSGLLKFAGGTWTLYDDDVVPDMISDIYEVEVAADGTVWVGAAYGDICQFDPASETCLTVYDEEDSRYFTDLLMDEQGRLVFATNSNIQILEGGATTKLVLESDMLVNNFVDSLALDPDGMLWVGTDGGTQRFDPANPDAPWETFKDSDGGPGGNWANEIYILPDGSVWLAIINGSLSAYDGATWTVYEDYYSIDHVTVDAAGRVWLGDEGDGITILDGANMTTLTEEDGLPSNYVRALLPDGEAMWIGTTSGLALYRDGQLEIIFNQEHDDIPSHNIGAILKEADGTFLLAASGALMRYDLAADELTILLQSGGDSLLSWYDSISDVAMGKAGRLWVSTYGGLLYSDDGGSSWVKLTTADGLPTNNINAIFADQFGSLWVAGGYSNGGGGLARYVP